MIHNYTPRPFGAKTGRAFSASANVAQPHRRLLADAVVACAGLVLPSSALTSELVEFMQGGVSLLVGTRSADLRPVGRRAFGARIDVADSAATVFVPACGAERLLANLKGNGQVAATFARPMDSRALQIKGHCLTVHETTAAERVVQDRYFAAFSAALVMLGQEPKLMRRVRYFPSYAVTFRIDSMFEQTPGPGAGRDVGQGLG